MELTVIQALERGVSAHRAGNLQEAERIYNAILQSQPNHPDANHNLGVLAVSVSKVDAAIPLFKKAVEANPKIEQFWLSYVDALIKLNQIDNAREVLRQGKTNGLSGDKVTSLEERLAETSNDSTSLQSAKDQLIELYKQGNFKEALEKGKPLLNRFPDDPVIPNILGAVNFELKNYGDALDCYQKVIAHKPKHADTRNNLGLISKELGNYKEAIRHFHRAIILDLSNSIAMNNLGATLKRQGTLNDATKHFERALLLQPADFNIYGNLADTLSELHDTNGAIQQSKRAIVLAPHLPTVYQKLGIALQTASGPLLSHHVLRRSVLVAPGNPNFRNNLGLSFYQMERYEEAIEHFSLALKIGQTKSEIPEILFNLGNCYQKTNAFQKATQLYSKAVEARPTFVEGLQNLGLMLAMQARFIESGQACRRAVILEPQLPSEYYYSAEIGLKIPFGAPRLSHYRNQLETPLFDLATNLLKGLSLCQLGMHNEGLNHLYRVKPVISFAPSETIKITRGAQDG